MDGFGAELALPAGELEKAQKGAVERSGEGAAVVGRVVEEVRLDRQAADDEVPG